MAASQWSNLVDGTYKGFRFHVAIPSSSAAHGITREETELSARNQVIRRPGVNGAEVVNFGLDPERYTVEVIFFGPNWQSLYEQFKSVLADPNPGKLVLPTYPKAVNACFERMTAIAQVGDGNAKTTTVTWIQDETTDQSGGAPTIGVQGAPGTALGPLGTAAAASTSALAAAQGAVNAAVAGANAVIQASEVLQVVAAAESGLSTARRFANTVLTLSSGIKNRIIQIQANLTNTLALVNQAVSTIASDLGLNSQSSAATAGAATQASNASSTSSAQATPTVDPLTGQVIVSNAQNSTVTPPANPLAPPAVQPNTGLSVGNLDSDTAKQSLSSAMISVLQSQSAEMSGYLNGLTDDITDSMTPVVTALQNFISAAVSSSSTTIMTTAELSLAEVMFYNGIGTDQLRTIHAQNPQILDPAVIPSGTVVYL